MRIHSHDGETDESVGRVVSVDGFNQYSSLGGQILSGSTHLVQSSSRAEAFCNVIAFLFVMAKNDSLKIERAQNLAVLSISNERSLWCRTLWWDG